MSAEALREYGLLAVGIGLVLAAFLIGRANRQFFRAVLTLVGMAAIAGWMHQRREPPPMPPAGIRLPAGATDLPSPVIETPAGGVDGFELEAFRLLHAFDYAEGGLDEIAVDPNGRWAAVSKMDGLVVLLDLEAREEVASAIVDRGANGSIYSLAFSPDGHRLGIGMTGRVEILSVPGGAVLHEMELPDRWGNRHAVTDLTVSPSGDVLVATGYPDLFFQDLRSGDGIGTLRSGQYGFTRLVWSRDGRSLAAVRAGRRMIAVWPTSNLWGLDGNGTLCRVVLTRDHWVDALAFGVDFVTEAEVLVATLGSEQKKARLAVWDAESCQPRGSYALGTARTLALSLTSDGRAALVFADGGILAAMRLADGTALATLETDPGADAVLSSAAGDRLLVVSYAYDRVTLYERRGGP